MLYQLTLTAFPKVPAKRRSMFAFLTASLHIISPAGMFLCAPYAESIFSFLNFSGFYFYARSLERTVGSFDASWVGFMLLSGAFFGIATTFRGNGLFSGLVLVYDAISTTILMLRSCDFANNIRRLLVTLIAGLMMGCLSVIPQYVAYLEYCTGQNIETPGRPWCSNWVPSIYAWVQRHYWWGYRSLLYSELSLPREVGFMRYWTVSNIPLFLLATPMLYILARSIIWALSGVVRSKPHSSKAIDRKSSGNIAQKNEHETNSKHTNGIARKLALPQILLVVLALTTYHVQIITRLSSGYPVWYWWLASMMIEDREIVFAGRRWRLAVCITRWMVIYAIIQGGLFASFLPPA